MEILNSGAIPDVTLNYTEVVTNSMNMSQHIMTMKLEDMSMFGSLAGYNVTKMQESIDRMTTKMNTMNVNDVFS